MRRLKFLFMMSFKSWIAYFFKIIQLFQPVFNFICDCCLLLDNN